MNLIPFMLCSLSNNCILERISTWTKEDRTHACIYKTISEATSSTAPTVPCVLGMDNNYSPHSMLKPLEAALFDNPLLRILYRQYIFENYILLAFRCNKHLDVKDDRSLVILRLQLGNACSCSGEGNITINFHSLHIKLLFWKTKIMPPHTVNNYTWMDKEKDFGLLKGSHQMLTHLRNTQAPFTFPNLKLLLLQIFHEVRTIYIYIYRLTHRLNY